MSKSNTGEQSANRGTAPVSEGAKLAVLFRRGDPSAVHQVMLRIQRIIAFRGFTIPKIDQKDLQQEVLRDLWQAATRPEFDPQAGFLSFVEVVTARRCIDNFRQQRPVTTPSIDLKDHRPGPLQDVLTQERTALASRALCSLDPACQELVRLRVVCGKNFQDISQLLGKSNGACRVRFHRCIRKAQRLLLQLEQQGSIES